MPADLPSPSPLKLGALRLPAPLERLRRRLRKFGDFLSRARARRAQAAYCGAFIAVTGSCGKTTTTLLIERLLAATGASIEGGRNYNSGRYVMRTMARLRAPVDFVVQEVSGHRPGAIAALTNHLTIDVAVVTVVGHDHNSAFNVPYSEAPPAIAAEKGRLVEALPPGGIACLNADDPLVAAMAARTAARVTTFGRSAGAEVRAVNVDARWPGRLCFDLEVDGRLMPVTTRFVGTIMLPNVLAALAVVRATGRDMAAAITALATVEPEPLHMSIRARASGRTYVLDTFKAPFWSTALLAADLEAIGGRGTLFVLGDMSDMRNDVARRYASVARQAASAADRVVLVGKATRAEARMQREGYLNVASAADLPALARLIASGPERLVILKANSAIHLETVIDLVEQADAPGDPHG
jgi:UDP-N-acetylmuramoyl-tripeptide--D-alanyl-D-alanine ligase